MQLQAKGFRYTYSAGIEDRYGSSGTSRCWQLAPKHYLMGRFVVQGSPGLLNESYKDGITVVSRGNIATNGTFGMWVGLEVDTKYGKKSGVRVQRASGLRASVGFFGA